MLRIVKVQMMSGVGYDVDFGLVITGLLECFGRGFAALYVHPVVVSVYWISHDLDDKYQEVYLHMKVTGTWILCTRSTMGKRE